MRDVILDDISYEERRQIDTHNRINQIEPVGMTLFEWAREQQDYLVDDPMEEEGSHSGKKAHQQGENNHKRLLADMLHSPLMQPLQPLRSPIRYCRLHFFIFGTDYTALF